MSEKPSSVEFTHAQKGCVTKGFVAMQDIHESLVARTRYVFEGEQRYNFTRMMETWASYDLANCAYMAGLLEPNQYEMEVLICNLDRIVHRAKFMKDTGEEAKNKRAVN